MSIFIANLVEDLGGALGRNPLALVPQGPLLPTFIHPKNPFSYGY